MCVTVVVSMWLCVIVCDHIFCGLVVRLWLCVVSVVCGSMGYYDWVLGCVRVSVFVCLCVYEL